ncbi:unnamed protein product [Umbelopsis vinacea]
MDDDELQAIRARRLAELQGQKGAPSGSPSRNAPTSSNNNKEDEQQKSDMEEMRRTMLVQILDNEARERLARINMVKADKARAVEDLLIRMAQSGQLRSKVSEKQLIELLGQINQQDAGASQTKIVYNRRRFDDDSDDDYDL